MRTEAFALGSSWWDLIERRAASTPDAVLLEDDRDRSLSCDGFKQRAEQTAAGLAALGVRSDHIVSWQLPTTLEAAVLIAALSRLGVAQNPIIPILRQAEVGLIVEQLRSDWVIVPGTWRGFDYRAMADDAIGDQPCRVIALDRLEPAAAGLTLPHGDPSSLTPASDPGDSVRWFYYSSGTTAAPKGAKHTDASATASSNGTVEMVRLAADDVFPVPFPISHIGGLMMLTAALRVGARLVLLDTFDPAHTPIVMAEHGATLLGSAVPFFLAYLDAQHRHGDEPLFPKLRQVLAGGAPVPPELHLELERVLGHGVINSWGLTEFPAATCLAVDDPAEKFLGTVGRPVSGVEVRAVGSEEVVQPLGVDGELRVRGPQCFAGYVDRTLDAGAFDTDGFFRTGDLGVIDADGYVRVTGRVKDIIIRNAENISAIEVEDALFEHPAIADVAVVGLPDPRTGERCCAVVVLAEPDGHVSLADLAAHCRARGLANQKIPEQLEIVPELPRNPMGKVLKHELRGRLVST